MIKNLHCKNTFELIYEFVHKFVDATFDDNTSFYEFGIFLRWWRILKSVYKSNNSGWTFKKMIKIVLKKTIRSEMKNKFWHSISHKELRTTLIDYLEDDSLVTNEGKKYNQFLGVKVSTNTNANALHIVKMTKNIGETILISKFLKSKNSIQKIKFLSSLFLLWNIVLMFL